MALKGPRHEIVTDISKTCSDVAERGLILVNNAAGSGVAEGDSAGSCKLSASSSGTKIHGMLLNDIVSVDETRFHRNFHKDEHVTGERCRVGRYGWWITNKYVGSPTDGAVAYLSSSGYLTPTLDPNGGLIATPKVGEFRGIPDANNYVKVEVALPKV